MKPGHSTTPAHARGAKTAREISVYGRLAAVDAVWFELVGALDLAVRRDPTCFVSYDGAGTLSVAPDADLDPDDTVAALLLHELCHHAVRGDAGRSEADWGLTYAAEPDTADEHAALRLQRWLARSVQLDGILHPTTVHRAYYDALAAVEQGAPVDDSQYADDEPRVLAMAARGQAWLTSRHWWPQLKSALQCTAVAARVGDGAESANVDSGHVLARATFGCTLSARDREPC